MKRFALFSLVILFTACQTDGPSESKALYKGEKFTVLPDKVIQGDFEAVALDRNRVRSNYQSPASQTYSRYIEFKFSLNEKDNELPVGVNHAVVVNDQSESLVFVFGKKEENPPQDPGTFLPPNTPFTFKVDLSPVLQQFENQGYYEAYDGSRIAQSEFKGLYIAGGSEPLT